MPYTPAPKIYKFAKVLFTFPKQVIPYSRDNEYTYFKKFCPNFDVLPCIEYSYSLLQLVTFCPKFGVLPCIEFNYSLLCYGEYCLVGILYLYKKGELKYL